MSRWTAATSPPPTAPRPWRRPAPGPAGPVFAGLVWARSLLERVVTGQAGRPVIAFVWARRSAPAGFALIPDDELRQQIRLLIDADVEISVFGSFDAETAHVIELARSVILEEDP